MSGQNASIGGEKFRDDSQWSAREDSWHQGKERATATPASQPDTIKATDDADGNGYADGLFDGYTADEIAAWRKHIADGLRTLDEVKDAYGLNETEVEVLQAPAPASKTTPTSTASGVEVRLAEIRQLRQTNPAEYWGDRIQAEELRLLGERNAGKADAEHNAAIQGFLDTLRSGAGDTTEMEAGFNELFPTLPSEDQDRVRQEIVSPTEPTRRATDAELAAFAERPEGKQLVAEWKHRAPEMVARFQTRLKAMAKADKTGKLATWFGERTTDEAASIARALAR